MTEVVVITGHAGGIGSALASAFAARGYKLVGLDRDSEVSVVDAEIRTDLADLVQSQQERDRVGAALTECIGDDRLAALINNAALQNLGAVHEIDAAALEQSLRVNAMAPLALSQLLYPALEACGSTIVNISSIHASQTKPDFAAYAASKAAFSSLSRSMAIEWGEKVRVLELRPAAVATPMLEAGFANDPEGRAALDALHPTKAIASPAELAEFVVELVRAQAAFLSGAVINFDGGISGCLNDPAFR